MMKDVLSAMKATKYPADVYVGKDITVADVIEAAELLQRQNDDLVARVASALESLENIIEGDKLDSFGNRDNNGIYGFYDIEIIRKKLTVLHSMLTGLRQQSTNEGSDGDE